LAVTAGRQSPTKATASATGCGDEQPPRRQVQIADGVEAKPTVRFGCHTGIANGIANGGVGDGKALRRVVAPATQSTAAGSRRAGFVVDLERQALMPSSRAASGSVVEEGREQMIRW